MSPPLRLLDQVRACCRLRHYSLRAERACVGWIRRPILANGKLHPRDMAAVEEEGFLSALAVRDGAASTREVDHIAQRAAS